ncbi:MAG: peptidyl-prolyl cis-trans isomerase [Polyangiaceae bacterium]|nr:peptidyl-prolyl cis-trans isomerase [Polyangiaceae bacterium]
MQRWTAIVFVALFLASIAIVIVKAGGSHSTPSASDAGTDAGETSDAGTEDASAQADLDADTPQNGDPPLEGPVTDAGTGIGRKLLSGEEPPPLGPDAPKSVVFGVILIQYKGAQGALPTARPKEEALALAKTLAAEAAQDFKAALQKGDKGSMENAGRIPRGVLEPAPEYVLFSLEKGGVSEPVDTPRGFWIVHRVE